MHFSHWLLPRELICIAISFSFLFSDRCLGRSFSTASDLEIRQTSANPDAKSFLRRGFQASTVVGHYLYLDGGDYSISDNGDIFIQYATTTLSIDLSQDWVNSTVTLKSSAKPSQAPSFKHPSLWYNEARNVLYTGFTGGPSTESNSTQTLPDPSLWAFALDGMGGGTWSSVISSKDSKWSALNQPTPDSALQAFGPTEVIILGGNDQNINVVLPGYVQFDLNSLTFANMSGTPYDSVIGVQGGSMTYVPFFGSKGIYVAMGGLSTDNKAGLLSFQHVSVFDPALQKWYNQTTTGQAPSGRLEFCAAGVNSTNQTFEIFVYGGWGTQLGQDAIQYDTINILTLPAFNWIQVPYNTANPRHAHSCNAVGGSQIVSIGGVDSNAKDPLDGSSSYGSKDPYAQGLAIFDMTTLQWASKYTANVPPYEQSSPVKNYYASNNGAYLQGLAPAVKTLMTQKNFGPQASLNSTNSTSSASPSATPVPASSTSAGTIAGAVIGSLLGLAIIAAIAIFLLRRRRQHRHSKLQSTTNSPPNHHYPENHSRGYNDDDDDSTSDAYQALHPKPHMSVPAPPQEVSAVSPPVELQDQRNLKHEAWEAPTPDHHYDHHYDADQRSPQQRRKNQTYVPYSKSDRSSGEVIELG